MADASEEDPHPRPTFPVVRIRQYRMETGNHFSNSTVDVGEVVTTSMTPYVSTGLTQVGAKHIESIGRCNEIRPSNDTSGIGDHGIGEAEVKS